MKMFEYGENKGCSCYFHPKEVVVGVCCMCLNERLLILASKQSGGGGGGGGGGAHQISKSKSRKNNYKPLSKFFHFTNSFIHRFEFRHWQPPPPPPPPNNYDSSDDDDDDTSTSSQEDSFISIKFENNGAVSWEKNNLSKDYLENERKNIRGSTSVVKHAKSRGPSFRWRKRIGYFFQVIRWKRSSQGNVGHVAAKLEGVKVRNGWIRSLTKRRTK